MNFINAVLVAGAIITPQGQVWVPVTPQTMLQQVDVHQQTSYGFPRYDKNGMETTPVIETNDDNRNKNTVFLPARF